MNSLLDQAVALHRSGKLDDAERLYRQIVAADAGAATARQLLGVVLAQKGRPREALVEIEQALALSPDDTEIHLNRANVLRMLGRNQEALAGFERVLAARPDWPQVLNNKGSILQDLHRPLEALAAYDRALALRPGVSAVINNRGSALMDLKRGAQALAAFDEALGLAPNDAVVWTNRGNALRLLGRHSEALTSYDRALVLAPDYVKGLHNRGAVLAHLKRPAAALADFERALALQPDQENALTGAALAVRNLCDFARAEKYGALVIARAQENKTVAPWMLLGYSGDEVLQRQCAEHTIATRFPGWSAPPARTRPGHDRIRLGYISSDFASHPVTHQLVRLIESHDRARFEVFGFSTGPDDKSPERARIAAAFDRFEDVRDKSPVAIAELIAARQIDLLIDLNGHTEGDSFDVLALRPAPIQVTWLGYAGTSGAPFIDYAIVDRVVAPDATAFSEQLAYLPHSFFPTDDSRVIGSAPARAEAGLPETGFVFCSFNQVWKFTPDIFAVWMRLLHQVDGSVLWLKQADPAAMANLLAAAAAAGIDPARLVFAGHAAMEVHLARHQLADLFLDTLPYNAHATAADALWSGLPVLTCRGSAFAGRVAASLLSAIGLPELITETLADYEATALALVRDPARLKALRGKLAANRATAPLFDTARFTRDLEALLIRLCRPVDANALVAQGLAALDRGDLDTALTLFDNAIAANPNVAAAHQGRGRVLAIQKNNAPALESFERALALAPDWLDALDGVALTALHLCDWQRVAQLGPELERRVALGQDISPWTLLGYSGDAGLQLRAARQDIALRVPPFPPLWRGERYGHDRIRLAYISSDLRQHAVGAQVVELIERHDRGRFEVLGISTTPDDGSALRARLVRAFDAFHDVSGQDHLAVARRIRALEVDVLVDLNGHTHQENFGVLAQRPARAQACWLGYAGTTGTDFLHLIADPVTAPDPAEFSEPVLHLPHSFFVSDTTRAIGAAPSRAEQNLPQDAFVFCSFNNNWKITAEVFAMWMRLLAAVPGSVLWLRQSGGGADANLRRAAQARDIAPERLVFARREEEIGVHLARHALADLFLDTLPYNAHATACDALWAGLPVLTCRGRAFAGRVASSLLTAIGLPELITERREDYEATALALARDPTRLKALREKLAANRSTAPLFDTARFARDLEALYLRLVQ